MENTTKNDQEIENFNALAYEWWDENGPMRPLHRLNPERIRYIKQQITSVLGHKEPNGTLKGLKILDVGCGAGLAGARRRPPAPRRGGLAGARGPGSPAPTWGLRRAELGAPVA